MPRRFIDRVVGGVELQLRSVAVVAVVADVALPSRLAVMVPAAKFPEASRLTIAPAVLLVALLAAVAPPAILAALSPPTEETTVDDWVPVTSPLSAPEKSVAVAAEMLRMA